jgi:hypothetical protein
VAAPVGAAVFPKKDQPRKAGQQAAEHVAHVGLRRVNGGNVRASPMTSAALHVSLPRHASKDFERQGDARIGRMVSQGDDAAGLASGYGRVHGILFAGCAC